MNRCTQGITILFISTLTPIAIKQSLKIGWRRPKIFNIKEEGSPLYSWTISLPNIKRSLQRHPTLTSTHRSAQPRNCKLKERLAVIFSQLAWHLTPYPILTENLKIITVIDIIIMGKMTFFKYHRWIDRWRFRRLLLRIATSSNLLRKRHQRAYSKTKGPSRTKSCPEPDHNSYSKMIPSTPIAIWYPSLQVNL
jgi:hypothetical protein